MKNIVKHTVTNMKNYMHPRALASLLGLTFILSSLSLQAHTPLFDCFDNNDGTITCEGGFTDGGSAEGISVRVLDAQGKVLAQGKLDARNSLILDRPSNEFSVVFDAGDDSHKIIVFGDDIY